MSIGSGIHHLCDASACHECSTQEAPGPYSLPLFTDTKTLNRSFFRHSELPSIGSLEVLLWFLHKNISDAAEKEVSFDQVFVFKIENSLKSKDSKHGGQAMLLINWLFQDELLFEPLTKGLANIITRKNDRYLFFGWCVLVRALVDYDNMISESPFSRTRERYNGLIKILSTCLPHLAGIVSQGRFALGSRFTLPCAFHNPL